MPPRPPCDSDIGILVLGSLTRADVPALCERLRGLVVGSGARVVACDVRALGADMAAVEALSRLQLVARRLGCRLRVSRASPELEALLSFCGLDEVLRVRGRGGQRAG